MCFFFQVAKVFPTIQHVRILFNVFELGMSSKLDDALKKLSEFKAFSDKWFKNWAGNLWIKSPIYYSGTKFYLRKMIYYKKLQVLSVKRRPLRIKDHIKSHLFIFSSRNPSSPTVLFGWTKNRTHDQVPRPGYKSSTFITRPWVTRNEFLPFMNSESRLLWSLWVPSIFDHISFFVGTKIRAQGQGP